MTLPPLISWLAKMKKKKNTRRTPWRKRRKHYSRKNTCKSSSQIPTLLLGFTTFLGTHRPQSVPILVHYLDALKSLRAIHYANAICEGLDPVEGLEFTKHNVRPTSNPMLEARAAAAFDILAKEELPAFVCHQYIQIVSASITARITGSLAPDLERCIRRSGRSVHLDRSFSEATTRSYSHQKSSIAQRSTG